MDTLGQLEALAILRDSDRTDIEHETAIHALAGYTDDETIAVLVQTLHDDEFGVRWAAANALAYCGKAALLPVLRDLVAHGTGVNLREVAQVALSKNTDPGVREISKPVLAAMKGPAADLATSQAAYELLKELEN
ncbi:MAG: HEAT repeat domain-containing protein [Chloroflexota bacterium]|nr:HEAT repeat domain-containing protein [Chloroflexota bacterium]